MNWTSLFHNFPWVSLFQNISIFAIGSGILAWLIRSLFKIFIEKDLEKYKHELIRERIQYTRLHERRANVIEDLYKLLDIFHSEMVSLMKPIQSGILPTPEEKVEKTSQSGIEFIRFCSEKKIFFNKDVVDIMNSINVAFHDAWIDYTSTLEDGKRYNHRAWNTMEKDVQQLKEKLEDEFRKLLGVA